MMGNRLLVVFYGLASFGVARFTFIQPVMMTGCYRHMCGRSNASVYPHKKKIVTVGHCLFTTG
jgi:hypothetical protein